jgi:hypothetical protein
MELFTATRKLKRVFFLITRVVRVARTSSTSSSAVNGRPLDFCLHRQPVSVNCLYHARMVLSVGRSFAYFARNARCTVTTDLLVWYSDTQNDFSPGAAIFSLHTLATPSGRNVNYDEKQFTGGFFSCSFYLHRFRKYVRYGFLIINFCNSGVHCERPGKSWWTSSVGKKASKSIWQLLLRNLQLALLFYVLFNSMNTI